MKKSTFKTYLLMLLVFLLVITVALTAFACKKDEEETPEEPDETTSDFTSLVTNGDFSTFTSGSTRPYSVSSWSTYNPNGSNDEAKVAGIIDTGADYDSDRSAWGDLANPYGAVTDNKLLMIYNKEEYAYGYTGTFSTDAAAYYSISVKVRVVNVDAENGASIRVYSDNGYVEFAKIASANEFATYTFYIQAPSSNATVTVRLSLGYDDHNVQGYAFFDDVVATKISAKDYNDATESATVKKASMLYPEGEFNYFTYSSSSTTSQTPVSWTWANGDNVAGKSVPTSPRYNGLISTEEEVWDKVKENYGDNPGLPVTDSADKYIMAIVKNATSDNSYSPTAGYYYTKNDITIERSTLYEISVWVKAIIDESDAKKGARVVLKGTDTYESPVINTTDKTAVNNGWAKVTIYVLGNQLRAQKFKLQLWIGDDEANDTLTQGKVFFDKLSIKAVDTAALTRNDIVTTYEAKKGNFETEYVSYVEFFDLKTEDEKLIVNDDFTDLDAETGLPTTLEMGAVDNVVVKEGDVIAKVITEADFASAETNWKEKYGIDENPNYPYSFNRVLIVNNTIPSAYEVKTVNPARADGLFEIKQSLAYRISVWIKTVGMDESDSVTLKLVDGDDKDIEASFSVNTLKYENDATNDYVEYTFYLIGEMPTATDGTAQSNFVRLVLTNGSGTKFSPASYQKGAFLIANINMEQITYTEYSSNSSTGTYSKSKDYASNSATITNGNFNSYDREKTTFGDDGYVAMSDKDDNKNLTGSVASWTNNVNKSYGTTKVEGEWLADTYHITKVESGENTNKDFTAAIAGKTITTINVTGTFDKTYSTEDDWKAVFDIDADSGKFTWKSGNSLAAGNYDVKIKANGEWLATTYHITKVDSGENANNEFTADIVGKTINEINITSDIDKTYNSESEWSKVFDIDTITGKFEWKSSNTLPACEYTVKIKVDEKELNDLIAGIININASAAYLAQFGLTANIIYDGWSAAAADDTKEKDVTFGAPNLLMITTRKGENPVSYITLKNTYVDGKATNDMTNTPALKSPTASLSANSFYHFRCYGKALDGAKGQVYVTTSSTDTKVTHYEVNLDDGWVEYNFYIQTGLSSVSAQFEIYYGEKGDDGDTHYSGTLLFDSFSFVSIDEKEFLAAPEAGRATFSTVTFDNNSTSETATSPTGFSKVNSSASSDEQVAGIISKNNFKHTTDDGKNNLGIYTTITKEENGETVTEDVIAEGSALSSSYIFSSVGMTDGAEVGDYLLMINNRKETYQSYYNSSSLSLSSDSYYKFSVYVRTAKIAKDKAAKVYVLISDEPLSFDVNTTKYDDAGNEIENPWQLLTFYFKNERDSSVSATIYFQLGENTDEGKMQGYLFIDNLSLVKISADDYATATADNEVYEKDANDQFVLDEDGNKVLTEASKTYRLTNKVTVLEKIEDTTDEEEDPNKEEEEDPEKKGINTTLLWAYITSIVIAVILIAVIVAWLIRKYRRPRAVTSGDKANYDRTKKKSEGEDAKSTGSARDEFKD